MATANGVGPMIYYATWKAHGTTYQTKMCETLKEAEVLVFGIASAPQRDSVTFYQLEKDSTG